MTAFINDEVMGKTGQNLSPLELKVLVDMANGNSLRDIQESTQTDSATLRIVELQIRNKLGAKTPSHMIARGFTLGVLIPRALCLLLSVLCATEHTDDSNRNQTRRNSRTTPASRLARSNLSRMASGSRNHLDASLIAPYTQPAYSIA